MPIASIDRRNGVDRASFFSIHMPIASIDHRKGIDRASFFSIHMPIASIDRSPQRHRSGIVLQHSHAHCIALPDPVKIFIIRSSLEASEYKEILSPKSPNP
jgi:hypothetical protein